MWGSRRQSRDQCDVPRFRSGCSKSSGSTACGDPGGRSSSGERKWKLTPWFLRYTVTVLHIRAANEDGAVLQAARLRKERTYPELVGPRRWARLGGVGRRKPDGSCPCWPERRPSQSHPSCCRSELSKRGGWGDLGLCRCPCARSLTPGVQTWRG